MEITEKMVLIPASAIDGLLNYLLKQPYGEVSGIIKELESKSKVIMPAEKEKPIPEGPVKKEGGQE